MLRAAVTVSVLMLATALLPAQSIPTLGPLDAAGRVTYFIANGEAGSAFKPADRDLATWALSAWERASDGRLRFEPSAEEAALLRVHWVPASGGQYGEMRSMRLGDRRGAAVFIRPDTDALGTDIGGAARRDSLLRDAIVYLTCLHELGHALGLTHTSDIRDIMYYFGFGGDIPGFFSRYRARLRTRDDVPGVAGLSDADIARVRALYPAR